MNLRANPFSRSIPRGRAFSSAGAAVPIPGFPGQMYDPTRECFVQATEVFWLRPHPTFDRIGPRLPSGTGSIVEAYTPHVQGNLRLWRVRGPETGTVGYAAFTERNGEVTGFESIEGNCGAVSVDNTPLRGGASPANTSRPQTVVAPPPAAPRAAPRSSSSPVLALAALMALGAGGVLIWRNRSRRR